MNRATTSYSEELAIRKRHERLNHTITFLGLVLAVIVFALCGAWGLI